MEMELLVGKIVDEFLDFYNDTSNAMLELTTTMSIDEEICKFFCDYENDYFLKFAQIFERHGIVHKNIIEKIYLAYTLIDLLGLEKTNNNHKFINFNRMKNETIHVIVNLLK